MKRKIILISALALLLLFTVAPVMAEPTKGLKVPAYRSALHYISYDTLTALVAPDPNPYPAPTVNNLWVTNGGIVHNRDRSQYFTITVVIDNVPYDGVSCNVQRVNGNPDDGVCVTLYDTIWYIGDVGNINSGFAGNIEQKLYGWTGSSQSSLIVHTVMHGFGDFEGQTLYFENWVGYCLKG